MLCQRLGRGQHVAQFNFHFLQFGFGLGVFGLAFIGDREAFLDRANQVSVCLIDRLDVKNTVFHFFAHVKRFSGGSLASRAPYLGLFIARLEAFADGAYWFLGFFKTFGVQPQLIAQNLAPHFFDVTTL